MYSWARGWLRRSLFQVCSCNLETQGAASVKGAALCLGRRFNKSANRGAVEQATALDGTGFTDADRKNGFPVGELVEVGTTEPEKYPGGFMVGEFRQRCGCGGVRGVGMNGIHGSKRLGLVTASMKSPVPYGHDAPKCDPV